MSAKEWKWIKIDSWSISYGKIAKNQWKIALLELGQMEDVERRIKDVYN